MDNAASLNLFGRRLLSSCSTASPSTSFGSSNGAVAFGTAVPIALPGWATVKSKSYAPSLSLTGKCFIDGRRVKKCVMDKGLVIIAKPEYMKKKFSATRDGDVIDRRC